MKKAKIIDIQIGCFTFVAMIFDISSYKKLRNLYLKLKIVQNAKRLYIICFIENNEGISVGEIVDFLKEPQAIVSQKLAQLRKAELVSSIKERNKSYYKASKENISELVYISNMLLDKTASSDKLKDNYSEISQAYSKLKIIINATRWNIMDMLYKKGEMSQKELLEYFQIKQPFMAQNLKLLQKENYIFEKKRGRDKFYTVNVEMLKIIKKAIKD